MVLTEKQLERIIIARSHARDYRQFWLTEGQTSNFTERNVPIAVSNITALLADLDFSLALIGERFGPPARSEGEPDVDPNDFPFTNLRR